MSKIYICGKITGRPVHEVSMQFGEAELKLKKEGYEVVNPLNVVNDWHMPWPAAMRLCIAALMQCEFLYLLPNVAASRGATIEMELANKVGIKIIKHE